MRSTTRVSSRIAIRYRTGGIDLHREQRGQTRTVASLTTALATLLMHVVRCCDAVVPLLVTFGLLGEQIRLGAAMLDSVGSGVGAYELCPGAGFVHTDCQPVCFLWTVGTQACGMTRARPCFVLAACP